MLMLYIGYKKALRGFYSKLDRSSSPAKLKRVWGWNHSGCREIICGVLWRGLQAQRNIMLWYKFINKFIFYTLFAFFLLNY